MLEKNVPDYYPAMYQDGYTPTEILAEEDAAERPRAALERQPAFQHTPHCESGGEEMRVDNTRRERQEKKRKSQSKSQLEAMIFSVIQSCIKSTVDEAMKEIFKDFK